MQINTGRTKVYIDGQSGTTGLQIYDRSGSRDDLELLRIDEDKRHDNEERRCFLNSCCGSMRTSGTTTRSAAVS